MKKSFILSLLCMGLFSYAQMGIGTSTPRGALDINQPTTNDAGLVLPTNSNVANIINPQTNGAPVSGTIMYDSTQDCVRLYTNAWSNCIGQQSSSGGPGGALGIRAMLGSSGGYGNTATQSWLRSISDRTRFGASGTYNNAIMWITTTRNLNAGEGFATEDMDSGADIYSKYSILNLTGDFGVSFFRTSKDHGTIDRASIYAAKLKEFVNSGGVLFIELHQQVSNPAAGRRPLVQELFREYVGSDLAYLPGSSFRRIPNAQNVIITDNSVNNGPFGDQRNTRYLPQYINPATWSALSYEPIAASSLPVGSEIYLLDTQSEEPLVFATGPDNRVIFYFSQEMTIGIGDSNYPENFVKNKFIYNQTVNLIEKTK